MDNNDKIQYIYIYSTNLANNIVILWLLIRESNESQVALFDLIIPFQRHLPFLRIFLNSY